MIIYRREKRELVVPNGLGNLNGVTDEILNELREEGAEEQKEKLQDLYVSENGVYESPDGFKRVDVNVNGGGGEGGECRIGQLHADFENMSGDGKAWWYAHDQGMDGFNYVEIDAQQYGQERQDQGYQEGYRDGVRAGEGGESGCFNQDRWIGPSFEDLIADDLIVITPEEGYDGMHRVVITRTEACAPIDMYAVYQTFYAEALTKGENIAADMYNYMNEHDGALSGFFDNLDPYYMITGEWQTKVAFTKDQAWFDGSLKYMANMYNGDAIVPFIAFHGFNCENVETIEDAFRGWSKLKSITTLYQLGDAFKTEQVLDLSMTDLNNNPNTKIMIKSLKDFKYGGPNRYGVTTSYIKGLNNFRAEIEDRGWTVID